ncbi:hypothetical protein [Methylobacterium nodulans]|uniref:Uncharacterized protein n=1 Tax=Methylobacterium nodulans (strain LMG 21967 / CNCM I-2342 / ORS 2060) TaxID=460265 RepID=B8IHQ8_METNO|nr:hypothetical protein [Methylobacterium nodulans]ACL61721.1 hypothetical protein Mnod_6979 [Methylobacterium nodulans ORS 2060]
MPSHQETSIVAFPGPGDTAKRVAASRLRDAVEALAAAERRLNEITLTLVAGSIDFARTSSDAEKAITEATARVFERRRALDEIRFELVAPEDHRLVANDEEDLERAHKARLREIEAEIPTYAPPRLTAACLGLSSVSR